MTAEGIEMVLFAISFLALIFFTLKILYRKIKGVAITQNTTIYFYISFWGIPISLAFYNFKESYVTSSNMIVAGFIITSFFLFLKAIYSAIKKRGNTKKLFAMSIATFFVIIPIMNIAESLEPEDMRTARLMKEELRRQEEANELAMVEKEEQKKQERERLEKEKSEADRIAKEKAIKEKKKDKEKKEAEEKAQKEKLLAEEKERQELQKKYDEQAKYEEWLEWKKQEDEKNNTLLAYTFDYIKNNDTATYTIIDESLWSLDGKINIKDMQTWEYKPVSRKKNIIQADEFIFSEDISDYLLKPDKEILTMNGAFTGTGVLARRLLYRGESVIIPVFCGLFSGGVPSLGYVYKTGVYTTPQYAINTTYVRYMGALKGKGAEHGGVLLRPYINPDGNFNFIIKQVGMTILFGDEFDSNLEEDIHEEDMLLPYAQMKSY